MVPLTELMWESILVRSAIFSQQVAWCFAASV
jgi:hypothetical protein